MVKLFANTVEKFPERNALAWKPPPVEGKSDDWKFWTWNEYYNDCQRFAKTLISLNIPMFHIVNILGFNSPEWIIANNGAQLAGCIAAGIYATNTPDACQYVTQHSKAEVVVLEDLKQLNKYKGARATCTNLQYLVTYDERASEEEIAEFARDGIEVCHWDDFLSLGDEVPTAEVLERCAAIKPGNCSTLIYTSGMCLSFVSVICVCHLCLSFVFVMCCGVL